MSKSSTSSKLLFIAAALAIDRIINYMMKSIYDVETKIPTLEKKKPTLEEYCDPNISKSSTISKFIFTAASISARVLVVGGIIYYIQKKFYKVPSLLEKYIIKYKSENKGELKFGAEIMIKYFEENCPFKDKSSPEYKNARKMLFCKKKETIEADIKKILPIYQQIDDLLTQNKYKIEQIKVLSALMKKNIIHTSEQKEENKILIKEFIISPYNLILDLISDYRIASDTKKMKDLLQQNLNQSLKNEQWMKKDPFELEQNIKTLKTLQAIVDNGISDQKTKYATFLSHKQLSNIAYISRQQYLLYNIIGDYLEFEKLELSNGGIYIDREKLYSGGYNNPDDKLYEMICLGGGYPDYDSDYKISDFFWGLV